MSLTWFAPFFLVMLIYACRGERQWALSTIVASFFQAASPLLVIGAGRINGLQPAYFLLPVGVFQLLGRYASAKHVREPPGGLTASHLFIFALTVIGVSGAFLLPLIFGGVAHVTSPRIQVVEILHFSVGNLVQAFYMVCNFVLFALMAGCIRRGSITVSQAIRALALGTGIVTLLGIYQIYCDALHLPWPDVVINSNLGSMQLYFQGTSGLVHALGITRRMSSTFLEPSMMSVYMLGMFGLFALGLRRWWIGGTVLFCLIISTSTTALIGLCASIVIWVLWEAPRKKISLAAASAITLAAAVAIGAVLFFTFVHHGGGGSNPFDEKMASESGQIRGHMDAIAMQTFKETWGFGTGVGSTRASSFIITFAASTGIPGLICLFGFFGTVVAKAVRSANAEIRALGLGLAAFSVGWSLSVPDMTLALIWVLSGLICGAPAETSSDVRSVPFAHARGLRLAGRAAVQRGIMSDA